MTKLEKLESVLADGSWHSTEELVQFVGHRFSATIHIAIHQHRYQIEKRRSIDNQFEYRKLVGIQQVVEKQDSKRVRVGGRVED